VAAVGAHEGGGVARRDDAVHDEDHRRGAVVDGPDRIETVRDVDLEARGGEACSHCVAMLVWHILGGVQSDAAPGGGIRRQRTPDATEEPGRRSNVRSAQGLGEGDEGTVGDSALEFAQHPQLPRLRVVQDRDGLRAELERGVGAPHRRVGRVESQHEADPAPPRQPPTRYPQSWGEVGPRREAGEEPVCSAPTGGLHRSVVLGRSALAVVGLVTTVGLISDIVHSVGALGFRRRTR
jgi:hypothetical protein